MEKTNLNEHITYQDEESQNGFANAGAYFFVDATYEDKVTKEIAGLKMCIATTQTLERPRRNLWHIIQHIFTCTSCTEDVRVVLPVRRWDKQITHLSSLLQILKLRVIQLNQTASQARENKPRDSFGRDYTHVYLSFPYDKGRNSSETLQG
ncbi:MAG: hypothetical protein SP4CHLAM5_02110 [Chlamydiia bacterium]|nr:hypothetical protein [Chlamydiia bacterium]MCH9618085.1 hypothetical protein [Chlamydiia bacterium]MCH9624195.1 hypothetical protein [Chlamydiia bacterium]